VEIKFADNFISPAGTSHHPNNYMHYIYYELTLLSELESEFIYLQKVLHSTRMQNMPQHELNVV